MSRFSKYKEVIFVALVSFIPLLVLLNPGLPVTHDGQDHVARIANFYNSLSEGNIIPRWAGNLNWGFGHPILMFLYPFSSYFASIFHFIGFSLVDSVKIIFAIGFTLSGIFMFLWVRNFWGEKAGIVAAVLYMYAPYRFIDLYVRGAIGEHMAFIFPPLILYFLYKIFNSKKFEFLYFSGASFAFAFLLLAHNAISIMFLPFFIGYAFYLILISKKRINLFAQFAGVLILGVGLSAFFLIPAFIEGKYTLRDIVTGSEALSRFVKFNDLIYGPWVYGITGQFTVQVGLIQWVFILLSPFALYKFFTSKKKDYLFYAFTLVYFSASVFIMLRESEAIWRILTTLQKFQFPWRFLSVTVFMSAIISAGVVYLLPQRLKKIVFVIVVLSSLFLTREYWKPKSFQEKNEEFYSGIYNSTTDTGESAPIWSVRFMEKRASSSAEIIEGSGSIKEISRKSTEHKYEVAASNTIRIKENTLYFPGWVVLVDEKPVEIQFQDPQNRGLITYYVGKGKHEVRVIFTETKLRMISNLTSLLSILILLLIYFENKTKFIYSRIKNAISKK